MRGWATRFAATVGVRESDVEDAAQEAAVRVWRTLDRLDPGRDPWPLLVKVAREAVLTYARDYRRRVAPPVYAVVDEATRYDTTSAAALDAVERPAIRAALAELSPRERDAVVLIDLCDVAPEDAARRLGLDPAAGALRQARRRAHGKLRVALAHLSDAA